MIKRVNLAFKVFGYINTMNTCIRSVMLHFVCIVQFSVCVGSKIKMAVVSVTMCVTNYYMYIFMYLFVCKCVCVCVWDTCKHL